MSWRSSKKGIFENCVEGLCCLLMAVCWFGAGLLSCRRCLFGQDGAQSTNMFLFHVLAVVSYKGVVAELGQPAFAIDIDENHPAKALAKSIGNVVDHPNDV